MAAPKLVHLINFSRKLAINSVFFLVPLHFLRLGFNGWQIGVITSLYAFAPLLFSFPTGWLNDRISIKEIIHVALALLSLLFFLMSRIQEFLPMAIIFLFLGLANNALDVSINSLYFKDETHIDQNKKYSRLVFWASLGSAAGPFLGGMVITSWSFPTLFLVFSVFLLLLQAFVRPLQQVRFGSVPLKAYRKNLLNKKTILFSVMIFVVGLHWGVEGTVYSPFLKRYFNLTTFDLSIYISLSLLALALSSFLVGFVKYDIRVNKRLFLLSMLLSGSGLILMVNPSLSLSFFFRVIHEAGDGFLGALVILFISRLFERESIGGSSAVLLAVMTFGHMIGAISFSSLGFRFGLIYPFLVAGLLLVANSVFGVYCFRNVEY
jgi:DHA1 family multidrug resistance protein-like MFS transporter